MEWLLSELNDIRVDTKTIARVKDEVKVMEESVVGVEKQPVYPHHHGRVHTPLPGPVTITEKGVEKGQVIGLYPTEGNNVWRNLNSVLDWSGVGGVYETAPRLEEEFKYVPGL